MTRARENVYTISVSLKWEVGVEMSSMIKRKREIERKAYEVRKE